MASLYAHGASPRFIPLGADDKSIKIPPRADENYPQHLPKFYVLSNRGVTKDIIADGATAKAILGADAFDPTKPYYTHGTHFAATSMGAGQEIMLQRVIPDDAGVEANVAVYLDVLETMVDNYQRDSFGNIQVDGSGNKILDAAKPKIKGYTFKWITEVDKTNEVLQAGLLTPKGGQRVGQVERISFSDTETEEVEVGTGQFETVQVRDMTKETPIVFEPTSVPSTQTDEMKADFEKQIKLDLGISNIKVEKADVVATGIVYKTSVFTTWDDVNNNQAKFQNIIATTGIRIKRASDVDYTTLDPKSLAAMYQDILTLGWNPTDITETIIPDGSLILSVTPGTQGQYLFENVLIYIGTYTKHMFKDVQREIMKKEIRPKKIITLVDTTSTMYPIVETRGAYQGSGYNLRGFGFNIPYLTEFNEKLAKATKKYPLTLTMYTRKDEKSSPEVFRSLYGENEVEVLLTDEVTIDPSILARADAEYVFSTKWYNEKDPIKPYKPFDYKFFKIYGQYYKMICKRVLENEKEVIGFDPKLYPDGEYASSISWYDFDATKKEDLEDQEQLLNLLSCKTSKNIRLQTAQLSEDRPVLTANQKEVNMGSNKAIFMEGGSDGTITKENYEKLVGKELNKYADIDSDVMELAYNVESAFWDSGFNLDVKFDIMDFISVRKDTWIVLSTHIDGERPLPLSKARARAVALTTRLRLNPESTYFGTPVCRGLVVGGAGLVRDEDTGIFRPQSYDLLVKTSRFAGASNGKWKMEYLFDHGDQAVITTMTDLVPEFIPHSIKPTLWNANMIWSQRYDRVNYFFPALQTVYDNDTSVLNSYFTIIALCTVTKVAHKCWKYFSGTISLTENEFKAAVEDFLEKELAGRFGKIINTVPVCEITDDDRQRGYSWRMKIKLAANNMKTVCVYNTEVYRMGEENA